MAANVRETAVRILLNIESKDGKSHLLLNEAREKHPEYSDQDRRFLMNLVQGTLENLMLLDARINRVSKVKVKKMKPAIRQIIRIGAYQIFFMDRVPNSAACNEAVKLTARFQLSGLKGFVNGVLRTMSRVEIWPEEDISIQYSVPQWILSMWQDEYGVTAVEEMLKHLTENKYTYFRMDTSRMTEQDILENLRMEGVSCRPAAFPKGAWIMEQGERLEGLSAVKNGWIRIQDASSMMVGTLAPVQEGQHVLDVCAAPGGKTIHVAERLRESGHVIACDLTDAKVELMRSNIERACLQNTEVIRQDALTHRDEWNESMDLVIADLPCSGLGVIGRKPEIRYRVTAEQVQELAALQRRILQNIASYVKPGGVLMYSTCTITPEENRKNRQWILENLPFEAMVFPSESIPEHFRDRSQDGSLQMLPGIDPCDGFYLSIFKKECES